MASKTILVSILLLVLGIAAAVAGFLAESTRVKLGGAEHRPAPLLTTPLRPTMGLALAATAALVLARIIVTSTTGGCCSCCRTIPNLPKIAGVCIAISWIMSFVAIVLFLGAAKLSSTKGVEIETNGVYYCYTVRPGIFLTAGIMGLVAVLLALVYYNLYALATNSTTKTPGVELQLEAPPINNGKKRGISDGKQPPITNGKKPPIPLQKH